MTRKWHNLAQFRAERLRAAVLIVASFCFAACTGGPHPEPPDLESPGKAVDGGASGSSGAGGGTMMEPGNAGGSGGTAAGSGGTSGAAGSGAADGGNADCDTDDMDAGACASDDDAGALR
jgi:hypothetical protein